MDNFDFSCWVIRYGRVSIHGKTYQPDSLKSSGGLTVPLLWNHNHNSPDSVLGHARIEHNNVGVYAYCTLYDTRFKDDVIRMIQDRGSVSLSPYINNVKMDDKNITHGVIREVSLVYARVDPDEIYYPVMRKDG